MNKKEFLESLDKVEKNLKEDKEERIYNQFSKPYSDGTRINEIDSDIVEDDDIKTNGKYNHIISFCHYVNKINIRHQYHQ